MLPGPWWLAQPTLPPFSRFTDCLWANSHPQPKVAARPLLTAARVAAATPHLNSPLQATAGRGVVEPLDFGDG